jgi:hypothetical protein
MYMFGDEELRTASPEVILRRMLSTKSAISTKSSLAEANQRAHDDASQQRFSIIGKGQCGSIFALKGTQMVVKLPNSANKIEELHSDFRIHRRIHNAFITVFSNHRNIHIPKPEVWLTSGSEHFWSQNASLFGHDVEVPNYGLVSERIYPLPYPVREAIVNALCPKPILNARDAFLKHPENKDCLIRLYLGRRHDNRISNPQNIRLRNFPMHVDEMERIGLDTKRYAKVMAEALAVMHWKAGVDATDVEYVLGSSPMVAGKPSDADVDAADIDALGKLYHTDFEHRTISLWLLDFNECKQFEHNREGMTRLVRGFWFNDPYFPRPIPTNIKDEELWYAFSSHYLEVSQELVGENAGPKMFIDGVVEEGKKRGGNSLFG